MDPALDIMEAPPLDPGNDMESWEYFSRRLSSRISAVGETCSVTAERPLAASGVLSTSLQDKAGDIPEDAVSNHERLLAKNLHQVAPTTEEDELPLQRHNQDFASLTRRVSKWLCELNNETGDAGVSPTKTEERVGKLQLSPEDFCSHLTRCQWTKVLEASERASKVMDLEVNPPMFQDPSVGTIDLLPLPPKVLEPRKPSSPRKRSRSHVLDLEECCHVPPQSTAKRASGTDTAMSLQHSPFRHVLLGNANDDFEINELAQVLDHPQYCPDTQTDGVMSSIEIEYAWLCEESLHCCGGTLIEWDFVYKHASRALKAQLRDGTELVREQIAEATAEKRKHIRLLLRRGYRRASMKTLISFHRLEYLRRTSFGRLNPKNRLPPNAGSTVPTKKRGATLLVKKPAPKVSHKVPSSILTDNEEEIAWLVEESLMQNVAEGIDHKYILANASPALHAAMECHSRRWLPRLVRLQDVKVKIEFERKRAEIKMLLYSGYRRLETKNVLPAGIVSASQYKESQSRRD